MSDLLTLKVRGRQYYGSWGTRPLYRLGPLLAKLFNEATTPKGQPLGNSLVLAGEPFVWIRYCNEASEVVPGNAHQFKNLPKDWGELAYTRLQIDRFSTGIWFARGGSQEPRLCIFRLHAEQEVLGQILRQTIRKKIRYEPRTESGDQLERCFNRATQLILGPEKYGVRHSLREAMNAYTSLVTSSERCLLIQQLKEARRQIRVKIERFTQFIGSTDTPTYVSVNGTLNIGQVIKQGDKYVTNTTITFGDGNTFHGDVIAAANIENSFNAAGDVNDEALKSHLEKLSTAVGDLCASLDDDAGKQRQVSRKLKSFVEEAAAEEPDKDFLKVTGEGLIEAAKTVASLVSPITVAVKGVMALISA